MGHWLKSLGTRQKIIDKIVEHMPYEQKYSLIAIYITCAIYFLEHCVIILMLTIITLDLQPEFDSKNKPDMIWIGSLLALRILLNIAFVLTKYRYKFHYLVLKAIQIVSIFLFRQKIALPVVAIEFLTDIVYQYGKEQRNINFDSRLSYGYQIWSAATLQFLIFLFNVGRNEGKAHGFVFLLSIGAFVKVFLTKYSTFYSLKLKNYLQYFCWATVAFTLYFYILLYIKKEQRLTRIGTFIVPLAILIAVTIWTLKTGSFRKIQSCYLWLDYEKLNVQDKVNFIWEGIYFVQAEGQQKQLVEILLNHSKNCSDISCPIIFKYRGSLRDNKQAIELHEHNYKRMLQRYIAKIISQSASLSPSIRQLLLFYNQSGHEKLIGRLKSSDFIERREQFRLNKEQTTKDIGTRLSDMQKCQAQAQQLIQEYLNKLHKLLTLLREQSIRVDDCQALGQHLLVTRNRILQIGLIFQQTNAQKMKSKANGGQAKAPEENNLLVTPNTQNNTRTPLTGTTLKLLNIFRKQVLEQSSLFYPDEIDENIKELMDSETPLIVVSAQINTIGKIVTLNQCASKLTHYLQEDLIGKNINVLIPSELQRAHYKILIEGAVKNSTLKSRQVESLTYVFKKTGYISVCRLKIKYMYGSSGRRWFVQMEEMSTNNAYFVCNKQLKICGITQNCLGYNLGLKDKGMQIKKEFVESIERQTSVSLGEFPSQQKSHMGSHAFTFTLASNSKIIQQYKFPPYYIIMMETQSNNMEIEYQQTAGRQKYYEPTIIQPRFQFYFYMSDAAYSNLARTTPISIPSQLEIASQQKISIADYGENINELIYRDGELQFRQNKRLTEQHNCQSHPMGLYAQKQHKAFKQLQNKTGLNEFLDVQQSSLGKPKRLLLILFGIFISSCVLLMGVQNYFVFNSFTIQSNRLEVMKLITRKIFEYEQILIELSMPIFEALQIIPIQEINMAESTQKLYRLQHNIDTVSMSLQKINPSIEGKWRSVAFQTVLPFYFHKETYGQVLGQLQLSLQSVKEAGQSKNLTQFKQTTSTCLYLIQQSVIPAIRHIMGSETKDFNKASEEDTRLRNIFMSCIIGIILILSVVTVVQIHSIDSERQSYFAIFASFQEQYLQNFATALAQLQTDLKHDIDIISQRSLPPGLELSSPIIPHRRKMRLKFRLLNLKFLTFIYFAGLVGLICILMCILSMKVECMSNIDKFLLAYEREVMDLNQIWLVKIQNSYRYLKTGENTKEEVKYMSDAYFDFFQNNYYQFLKDYKAGIYSAQFKAKYESIISSNYCQLLGQTSPNTSNKSTCPNNYNDFIVRSIDNQISIKAINVLNIYDEAQSAKINQADSSLYLQTNRAIYNMAAEADREKIFIQKVDQIYDREVILQKQSIIINLQAYNLFLGLLIILTGLAYIRLILKLQNYRLQPILILVRVFPLYILNKNIAFLDWYYNARNKFFH